MAFLFSCPYCAAQIRVPDGTGGRTGKCPCCIKRIRIPPAAGLSGFDRVLARLFGGAPTVSSGRRVANDVPPLETNAGDAASVRRSSRKSKTADAVAAVGIPTENPAAIAASETSLEFSEFRDGNDSQSATTDDAFGAWTGDEGDGSTTVLSAADDNSGWPAAASASPSAPVRSLRRKRSSLGIVILLAMVAAVGGGAGYYFYSTAAQIHGETTAVALRGFQPPSQTFEATSSKLSGPEVSDLLRQLKMAPVELSGTYVKAEFLVVDQQFMVRVQCRPDCRWVRVDPAQLPALRDYALSSGPAGNRLRQDLLQRGASEFLDVYAGVMRGGSAQALGPMRDKLGLSSMIRGVGGQCAAVNGRVISPCWYEDDQGRLYFPLPADLSEFDLTGHKVPGPFGAFPGKIRVTIAGEETVAPPKSMEQPLTPAEKDAPGLSERDPSDESMPMDADGKPMMKPE